MPKGMAGNTKIILAPDGVAKEEDKIIINENFNSDNIINILDVVLLVNAILDSN